MPTEMISPKPTEAATAMSSPAAPSDETLIETLICESTRQFHFVRKLRESAQNAALAIDTASSCF
jgi:hypothetical protein